AHRFTMQCR
ncbi:phosphoserine transaminase, partial [Vibrio parahaemolyticus AQ3810]